MMTMTSVQKRRPTAPDAAQLRLEALERLACGCVVAIQRVRPSGITVMSLEAKGPHCGFAAHRTDRVIRLGEAFEMPTYDAGDDVGF